MELDPDVAAVWETIFNGDAECLAQRILEFDLTAENARQTIAMTPGTKCERAFQTILRNRICHGGILAPGTGFLKRGENGKGIALAGTPKH